MLRLVIVVTVIARIAVVVFWAWPRPPWIEADIEDDPATVDKAAMMSMPPMVATAVPIMMPVRGMLRKDMVPPIRAKSVVSVANLTNAISDVLRGRDRAISSV